MKSVHALQSLSLIFITFPELVLAPAGETLSKKLESEAETFDLGFIDADKSSYGEYYEQIVKLLKPGGLLLVDNMLWSGKVADLSITDPDTVAIRELHETILNDSRVSASTLTLGDGVTFVVKL